MYLLVLCYYQILYDFFFKEKKSSFYPVKRKKINSCWPWSKNFLCSSVDVTAHIVNNSFVQTDQNCSDEDAGCGGLLFAV